MRKVTVIAILTGLIGSTLIGGALWLQAGLKSPIKTVQATDKKNTENTEKPITSPKVEEGPLWVINHYVSKTEWGYAQKWGITIPQWIERLGYARAEEIKERNGKIEQGDWIKIPVFKKTFSGTASYYGEETTGSTATGKKWNPEEESVAAVFLPKSPSIERQTVVDVTNLDNGKTIKGVEVEDSGPYAYDLKGGIKEPRVLDLSLGLKRKLGCEDLCQIRYTIRSVPQKYDKLS